MNRTASSLLGAVAALGAMAVGERSGVAGAAEPAPTVEGTMTAITDDLGLLSVAVPTTWSSTVTSPAESDSGNVIARLGATTDADGYSNLTASGVFVQSVPTVVSAPVVIADLAPDECTPSNGFEEWIHPDVTAGSIDVLDCGATTLHLAAGNIVGGEQRSIAVMLQLLPADAALVEPVLASVDYLGNGPNTATPEPTAPQPTAVPAPTAPPEHTAAPGPTTPALRSQLDITGAQAGLQRFLEAVPHRGVNVACPLVNHQVLSLAMANNGMTMDGSRWSAGRTVIGAIDNHPALRCFEPDGVGLSPAIEVFDISTLGGIDVLATSSWSPILDDAVTGGQFATVCRESGGTPHCTVTWHLDGLVVRMAVTAWSGSVEAEPVWHLLQGLLPTLVGNLATYTG